ncbi:AlbA family DNA-binding domain-containing protein [Bradyrhizobium sp. CCBAU 51627]|uniref:AlbA family DNA-binding domain-containing protein n=1 Tax=Bradyrhizobium sp. CCBAU 51627 TaxID=1325088 RepID=UPI002306C378|nr:ATP-binding protein [Bradyrhizobium sp. CCBAU 51627]
MRPVSEWTEKDIDDLYHGEIEESLTLEYKRSDALSKDKEHRRELFKDVSAMANGSGGIIIYGMKEIDQKPDGTDDGLDPNVVTREQIENVLMSNIDPPIEGLFIKPVELTSKGTGKVAYVLQIPAAKSRGPHQAPDFRYYKRFNFKSEPIRDNDVRDLMRRGIEYGRKYGAALDLYVEMARISSAAGARATPGAGTLDIGRAIISVSPDLRSAGSALVLLAPDLRKVVPGVIMRVDSYNAKVEARGGVNILLDSSARVELAKIKEAADEVCSQLSKILDQEP